MRFATCLIAVIVTTAACAKAPDARARQYIADGDRFAQAGKYGEAAIQYRNAIKLAPASVDAHEKLAQVAVLGREPAVAADALLRVAELKPDDPGAQLRAASIYLLSGRFEESRARAEAAIKADETNVSAHLVLGEALAALHEQAQSQASLQAAVRLAPALPAPHVALASAYWSAGRVAEAEAELRKAVELDPADVRANRALAMLLMATGRGRDAQGSWAAVADAPNGLPFALADYFGAMNRLAEAEQALASLAARPATRDAARVRLAAVQFTRGRHAEAHQTIRAVLLDSPHSVPALLLQARLFEAEHRLDDALRAARQAVADEPSRLEAALLEGEIHAERGDDGEADRAFQRASALNSRDPRPYMAMARFRLGRGRALEAVRAAERARTAAPDDIEARMTLVTALAQAGQHASAIEQSEAAIRDWPKRSELYLELGRLQLAVGKRNEALQALSTALRLDPTSIPVLAAITAAEMREGKGQAALRRIEQRLRTQPDDADLQLLSGRAYAAAGEDAKAEAALRRVVQQQPASSAGLMSLGRFYVDRGRLGDAREVFERLDQIDGRTGSSTVLGAILEEQDRPADAQRAFERALTANPQDRIAANNLAWLYQQQGRLDDALRWAIVANEQLRRGETRDTLGWIRVQRGEYREALPTLMAAIEAKPDNPLYRYHLAVAYSKTGSIAQARDELRRALATDSQFPGRDDAKRLAGELDDAHAANPNLPRSHPR